MPFEVSVVSQTPPILLLDVVGKVTSVDMSKHLDALEAEITKQGWLETPVYLMVDVAKSDMSFIDVVTGASTHAKPRRGSSNDPLTEAAFIGAGPMVEMLREMLRKQAPEGHFMQLFESRDAAAAYFVERDKAKNLLDNAAG